MKRFSSYRNALVWAFTLIGVVPLVIFAVYNYYYTYKLAERHIATYVSSNLNITSDLIQRDVDQFIEVLDYLEQDGDLVHILRRDLTDPGGTPEDTQAIKAKAEALTATFPTPVPLHVINVWGECRYSSVGQYAPVYRSGQQDMFQQMDNQHTPVIYARRSAEDGEEAVSLAIGKAVRAAEDEEQILGYLIIDVYDAYFQRIIDQIALQEEANILIMDDEGTIFSSRVRTPMEVDTYPDYALKHVDAPEGFYDTIIGPTSYKAYFNIVSSYPIYLVELVPTSYFHIESYLSINVSIPLFFIMIILIVFAVQILSEWMYDPINELASAMEKVEAGDFSVQVPEREDTELGLLGQRFNHMVDELNVLVEKDYKNRIAIEEAKFNALKAQVKPHFLYNSLNLISMMANLGKTKEVTQMSKALSDYYRYNVSDVEEMTTVGHELEQIERYLEIQKLRFLDRLTYSLEVEESMKDVPILKLILQPLVENAMVHGIEQKLGPGHVRIEGFQQEDNLVFRIMDNGHGFGTSKKTGESVGMTNTQNRIHYVYGTDYGITHDREGEFTVVTVTVAKETN